MAFNVASTSYSYSTIQLVAETIGRLRKECGAKMLIMAHQVRSWLRDIGDEMFEETREEFLRKELAKAGFSQLEESKSIVDNREFILVVGREPQ